MDASFRPKSGRYGVHTVFQVSEKIGALTSAATDTFRIPTPFRKAYYSRASAQAQVVPIVTTGTATATIKKAKAAGGTSTISAGLDLETLTANVGKVFSLAAAAVDADRIILEGDTLFVDVVNGTTIATAPTALFFVVELLLLE